MCLQQTKKLQFNGLQNNQYSLMVLLPSKKTNLNAVILSLTASQLAAYHNVTPTEVDLEIPKFTVRGDTDLTQIMKNVSCMLDH